MENKTTLYPRMTTNRNVPKNVFLVAEKVTMSGEIAVTYYIDCDGNIHKVSNWVTNTPQPAYPYELCRITGDTEQTVNNRWKLWLRHRLNSNPN